MYNFKKILFLLLTTFSLFSINSQTIPLTVLESRIIFEDITKKIQKIMPHGVEIFLYPPYLINTSEKDKKNLEKIIPEVFVDNAKKLNFEIITMDILKKKNSEIAISIEKNVGQDEIMWAANKMQYNAVIMINISKTENDTRNVWSHRKKAFLKKEIYLLQANMFYPENSTVFSRFSAYFFLDD